MGLTRNSDWSPATTFVVNAPVTREGTTNNTLETVAYPTIFESTTLIQLADLPGNTMTIEVYSDLGVLIETGEYATATNFELGEGYESGTYIVKITSEITTESLRVIKQ